MTIDTQNSLPITPQPILKSDDLFGQMCEWFSLCSRRQHNYLIVQVLRAFRVPPDRVVDLSF